MALAVDPCDGDNVYVVCYTSAFGHAAKTIFRSTDRGETWHDITYNLAPTSVGAVSVDPHDGYVYIRSFSGTWRLPPPD